MSQKKSVLYFITIVIIILSPLPILNTFFLYQNDNLNEKTFNKQQLYTTDPIESNINYILYKEYKTTLYKNKVIVGKDNFLFLGNSFKKVLDKAQGIYPYTLGEIDWWTTKLKNIQNYYNTNGIKFAIIIAPNKHTIYSDKLPNNIIYKTGKTITDEIVKYAKQKNINILNLKDTLLQNKIRTQLYFTTDTHWNNQGAEIGYKESMKFLANTFKVDYKLPKYSMPIAKDRRSGDISAILKINNLLPFNNEIEYQYKFEKNNQICLGNIDRYSLNFDKCKKANNPYINSAIPQYIINEEASNNSKLLWICDSFATASSKFYTRTFKETWVMHHNHIHGEKLAKFVKSIQPDLVIYQIVERDLYYPNLVLDLN